MNLRTPEQPFLSAHEALTFAFRFSAGQYPRTPMSRMMQAPGRSGSGVGLGGLDGAGQAGMILAALRNLSAEQRALLLVRYGDNPQPCPHCGTLVQSREWREAVEALSLVPELADLPKGIRVAAVEKIVARRRNISMEHWANKYGSSARSVRHRVAQAKRRLAAIENAAVGWLDDYLTGRGLIPNG